MKVTVIVPVYQAEAYLCRCIDSILSQENADLDLVLVDDGSSDHSPAICDDYAAGDYRVHVIHQRNSGPSAARNRGIEWALSASDSKFISFVDSDDMLHPRFLECMTAAADTYGAEIVMSGHRYVGPDRLPGEPVSFAEPRVQMVNAEDLMVAHSSSFNYAWGKLFSKDCFSETRFPEDVSFGEDNLTIFQVMFSDRRLAFVQEELYFYFYNPTGITKTPWTPESLGVFDGILEQLAFYKENGYHKAYKKEQELYIQQLAYQIHRIEADADNKKKHRSYLSELRKKMREAFRTYPSFRERDQFYWLEACRPGAAKLWSGMSRVKRMVFGR